MKLDITPVVDASLGIKNDRTKESIALYLNSEAGEVADWILNPQKSKEDLLGECADVIICAIDLAIQHIIQQYPHMSITDATNLAMFCLEAQLEIKSNKWVAKNGERDEA